MKKIIYLLFFAFTGALFVSCTIEKRLYLPGYNIQGPAVRRQRPVEICLPDDSFSSNRNIIIPFDDATTLKAPDIRQDQLYLTDTGKNTNSLFASADSSYFNSSPVNQLYTSKDSIVNNNTFDGQVAPNSEPPVPASAEPDERKTHWGANWGISFGVLGLLAWFLGPLAILFGIIALVYIKKYPAKYKGKTGAIIGILFGITAMIFAILIYT